MVDQEKPINIPASAMRPVAGIYNPDILTKQELIASFVVRIKKFQKLYAEISSAKMEKPEQHILVVGLRGMGKTTLLLRLGYEVENDPALNGWLMPLVFNEEEYSITRLFKLWETIAKYLEKKEPAFQGLFDRMDEAYLQNSDPEKHELTTFNLLLDALQQHGKKLLLFIDNFGDMFRRFTKQEKQRLREVLMTCPDLRIIAASSVVPESFFIYGDPLFEFFKIEKLEGLNKEETEVLLLRLGEHYPENPVKDILERQPERVEALRRLTGGIPRSIVLLFEIFTDDKNGTAFTDLESILDRVTPLYKHRMDDLPTQQQEIIDALAMSWDGASAKEIAQRCRLDSKVVSAQLKQMHQNDLVEVVPTHTKNHLYLLHDRFFNIWYLMRMGRKSEKSRVLWLVRFLEGWCDDALLSKRAKAHMVALSKEGYNPKAAYYLSHALYYSEKQDFDTRYNLARRTRQSLEKSDTGLHEQYSRSDMAFFAEAVDEIKRDHYEKATKKLLDIKDKTPQDYLLLSALYEAQGIEEQQIIYLRKAKAEKIDSLDRLMGTIFMNYLKKYQIAEVYYEKAVQEGDIKALRLLGVLHQDHLNNVNKAKKCYQKAIEAGETQSWINLGNLYCDELKDYTKAEECYQKAIELNHNTALRNIGLMYQEDLKNYAVAEEYYRLAIQKGKTSVWVDLGDLYCDELKDYIKAEEYYQKAIELGENEALRNMGLMYQNEIKDFTKAEEYYRLAIEKDDTFAWVDLGDLYCDELNDYIKAEEYYQKAIELGENEALGKMGFMYQNEIKDFTKAEEYYRLAIEKDDTFAWVDLGNLYCDELKDYAKAKEYYQRAIELGENAAFRNMGLMYQNDIRDFTKAEEYYQLAIEKNNTIAWVNLGNLYKNEIKDFTKAEEYYQKAIELGENEALRNMGLMYQYEIKDFTKAEKYYRLAIEKDAPIAWVNLGNLYKDNIKDYAKAEECYQMAIALGKNEALKSMGLMYQYEIKDFTKAGEYYRLAIEKGETSVWVNLGNMYCDELKDFAKAEEYYQKAIELNYNTALRNMGLMYQEDLKDYAKAKEYYQKAIEKGKTSAWVNLGNMYCDELKDFAKAIEYYQKAIDSGNKEALRKIANIYADELNDLLNAEKYFFQAIELNDQEAKNSLAWTYFKYKEKKAQALELAETAYEMIPECHVAHTLSTIYLWNEKFKESHKTAMDFLCDNEYMLESIDDQEFLLYFYLLLAKKQYTFLYDYFTGEQGQALALKDRLKPIWYALLYYLRDQYPAEYLRMPPELKQTVEEIIAKVEQMRVDYLASWEL